MIRTKVQADSHVSNVLKHLKSKQEKLVRGFQFAKIYLDIKEYNKAEEYIKGFLLVKCNYAAAHKLLAQIYEAKGSDPGEILDSYKKSFELDNGQKDVLLKICELYSKSDVDPSVAKYWVEKAEKQFPNNDIVFKLKVKMMEELTGNTNNSNNNDSSKMIDFYKSESARHPRDLSKKLQLLKGYLLNGRWDDAYECVVEAETQDVLFSESFDWYKCVVEVLSEYKKYKKDEKLASEFNEHYLFAVCRYASLCIGCSSSISAATAALWSFDQELVRCGGIADKDLSLRTLLTEMKAQYFFLCGTLILNKIQKEGLNWISMSDLSCACLLHSISTMPCNPKGAWFVAAPAKRKKFMERWYHLACYRASQAGHIAKKKSDDDVDGHKWVKRIQDDYFHQSGRNRLCQVLYGQHHGREDVEKSFFKTVMLDVVPEIPSISHLEEWDEVVQTSQPDNLPLLVWICLHYFLNVEETQPEYPFTLFPNLPERMDFSETLSQIHIQTFLMATIWCSASNLQEQLKHRSIGEPYLLPFSINDTLCSSAQAEWWSALNKLATSPLLTPYERSILQRGTEVVNLSGNHGMGVRLLVHLAKTWSGKLELQKQQLESTLDFSENELLLESYAQRFWEKSMTMIEKQLNNQYTPLPKVCLFDYRSAKSHASPDFLRKSHQEGLMFRYYQLKKSNNLEEALKVLRGIRTAESFYQSALIYEEMAGEELSGNLGEVAEDLKGDQINLLMKAKQALKDALDLASSDSSQEHTKEITNKMDDIENRLLSVQNFKDYEFVSEFGDDCTSFGLTKLCTPPKTLASSRSDFIASSTPYTRASTVRSKITSDPESLEVRLSSLTNYVYQKFLDVSEENKKLLERIFNLESKLATLESQKLMWMPSIPFNPQAHLQIYSGGPLKHTPESEYASRIANPLIMENKYTPVNPFNHLQQGMVLPTFNQTPSMTNMRHNYPMVNQDIHKSGYGMGNQFPGSFHNMQSFHEAESEYLYRNTSHHEGMLPSIDSSFIPTYPPPVSSSLVGNPSKTSYFPKSPFPVTQSPAPTSITGTTLSSASKTPQNLAVSQIPSSNSPLVKLLSSPMPSSQVTVKKEVTSIPSKPAEPQMFIKNSPVISKQQDEDTSAPKTVLGGLVFNTTPVVKSKSSSASQPHVKDKGKAPAANPFSDFSFGSIGNPMASSASFSFSLPNATTSTSSPSIASALLDRLASPVLVIEPDAAAENDESIEDYEPSGDFKPLVCLPIVSVVTGEEDDDKLFGDRAKLYRMDVNLKQWKERGVGEVKILQNKISKKCRLLMRRDQVLKVCANHYITSDMKLMGMTTSENSFCWFARDFAEEEMKEEQFCIKFKTDKIAAAFKECFEKCQTQLAEQDEPEQTPKSKEVPEVNSSAKVAGDKKDDTKAQIISGNISVKLGNIGGSLAEQFKLKDGEWSCDACYVKNPLDSLKCLSCESPKPGTDSTDKTVSSTENKSAPSFAFGSQGGFKFTTMGFSTNSSQEDKVVKSSMTLAEQFKPKDGEWTCDACYVKNPSLAIKCVSCETPKPGSESSSESDFGSTETKSTFSFGSQGGLNFSQIPSAGFSDFTFGSATKTTSSSDYNGLVNVQTTTFPKPVLNIFGSQSTVVSSGTWGAGFGSTLNVSVASSEVKSTLSPPKFVFGAVASPFGSQTAHASGGFSFNKPSTSTFAGPTAGSIETKPEVTKDKMTLTEDSGKQLKSSGFGFDVSTFSFNKTESGSGKEDFSDKTAISVTPDKNKTIFGSAKLPSAFSFAGISSNLNDKFGTPTPANLTVDPQSPQSPDDMYKNCEGEDDHIHFDPIVKLPENVSIKTGEEDEEVVYEGNAKLFRFQGNEWKERGVGTAKLLKNLVDGRVRMLMRRERIHKICCNHYICATMKLLPMTNSTKAFIWHADDYADGDRVHEQLCIKFRNEEQAEAFKEAFERIVKEMECKKETSFIEDPEDDCKIIHVKEPNEEYMLEAAKWELPKSFYNYLNAPSCPGCIGCDDEEFEFPTITSKESQDKDIKNDSVRCDEVIPTSSKSFLIPSTSFNTISISTPSNSLANNSGSPVVSSVFGATTEVLDFASLSSSNTAFKTDSGFSWKGAGEKLFATVSSPPSSRPPAREGDEEVEQGEDVHFEPLVNLPEVEVRTGEEDEDEVYRQRSKLFRFDGAAWKERGVGEIKILKNKSTVSYRLLFRRDQVHKVVCNHLLAIDMKFKYMETSTVALCWFANDFSEGEVKFEQFAIKFKTESIAEDFAKKIEDCQEDIRNAKP